MRRIIAVLIVVTIVFVVLETIGMATKALGNVKNGVSALVTKPVINMKRTLVVSADGTQMATSWVQVKVDPALPASHKKAFDTPPLVSALDMQQWSKVNTCETGGNWHTKGNIYQGGLGILLTNWYEYGGYSLFGPEWSATPQQQVYIAKKIQAHGGFANYVPDQYGCGTGW
jgi:Transglycosylase-like domain